MALDADLFHFLTIGEKKTFAVINKLFLCSYENPRKLPVLPGILNDILRKIQALFSESKGQLVNE